MSMIGNFVALEPSKLAALIEDPTTVEPFLYPDDDEGVPPNHLDVDKAWHAIHFTLNQRTWDGDGPLGLAVLGGQELGEDVGYGPARFLTPEEVQQVASAITAVTPEAFRAQFNPKALDEAEIYPQIWERDGDEGLDYVLHYFSELQSFYRQAAERGDGALLFIN
jgi:hypothetical protein